MALETLKRYSEKHILWWYSQHFCESVYKDCEAYPQHENHQDMRLYLRCDIVWLNNDSLALLVNVKCKQSQCARTSSQEFPVLELPKFITEKPSQCALKTLVCVPVHYVYSIRRGQMMILSAFLFGLSSFTVDLQRTFD